MTHDDLVRRAVQWLRKPCSAKNQDGKRWYKSGCGVVVPELVSYAPEQPDAIGWYGGNGSVVIECKTSRADFLSDRKKIHRNVSSAGLYRLYLCPPGIINAQDLTHGWGLLYCHEKRITLEAIPDVNQSRCAHTEIKMMYSLLRRVEVRGQLTRCLSPKWGGDVGTEPVAQ